MKQPEVFWSTKISSDYYQLSMIIQNVLPFFWLCLQAFLIILTKYEDLHFVAQYFYFGKMFSKLNLADLQSTQPLCEISTEKILIAIKKKLITRQCLGIARRNYISRVMNFWQKANFCHFRLNDGVVDYSILEKI